MWFEQSIWLVQLCCRRVNKKSLNKVSSVMGHDDRWPAMVPTVVPSYSRANSNLIGPHHYVVTYLHNHSIHFTVISWSLELRICPPIHDRKYSSFTFWSKFRPEYTQLEFPMVWFIPVSCCMVMVISATEYSLSEKATRKLKSRTVLPIANLRADAELGNPVS